MPGRIFSKAKASAGLVRSMFFNLPEPKAKGITLTDIVAIIAADPDFKGKGLHKRNGFLWFFMCA